MAEIKYKNHILVAIDHFSFYRKRSDISGICKFLLKHYNVSPKDTKADLKRCLKQRSVIKTYFNDNESYRNPARKKLNTNNSASDMTSERTVIISGITIIYKDLEDLKNGFAFDDLVSAASSQGSEYSNKQLETIINEELSSGRLVKLQNGNFTLGPGDHDGDSSDNVKFENNADINSKTSSSANSSCRSPLKRMKLRPKERRRARKAKKAAVHVVEPSEMAKNVFDPSDNNVPSKHKKGRPLGSLNKKTIKKRPLRDYHRKRSERKLLSESKLSLDRSGNDLEKDDLKNPIPNEPSAVATQGLGGTVPLPCPQAQGGLKSLPEIWIELNIL